MDTAIAATAAAKPAPVRLSPPLPSFSRRPYRLPLPRGRELVLDGAPKVMGVINVTPDSFSDGGRFLTPERALDHAREQLAAGAELLDLGAESTRPGGGVYGAGASEVPAASEIERLRPVLTRLRELTDLPISVDTRKSVVARWALSEGADLINDVSALGDPEMADVVREAGCPVVLMHSRGELGTMQVDPGYADVVEEVRRELADAMNRALLAGIDRESILLDPGLGFAKRAAHNLALLRHLDRLAELDRPLMVGASRKSFIGHLSGEPPDRRLPGSLAAVAWAASHQAAILRVHDVAETAQFLRVWTAVRDAEEGGG
jgi:dihydropteroate synthase